MRILLVTPFPPDLGASHGGGIVLGTLVHALAKHAELGLCALANPDEAERLREHGAPWTWAATAPSPARPRGAERLQHQLRMLWRWRTLPLVAAKHQSREMAKVLVRARQEFAPDLVLVEMAHMAQYLPQLAGLPTILTDHEAGCPGNTRTGLGSLGDRRDIRLWWQYVRRYYPMASAIQALTTQDAAVLAQVVGRPVAVRSPAFPVPASRVLPGRAPPRALFLGDYRHGPNPEAARMLVRDVLPRLREAEPSAELWLAGPNHENIASLAEIAGVRVLGYVPDLGELFGQVRLLLAPTFSGGGFRMKCIAALAHGLPVVTNELGGRGSTTLPPPALTICEGPQALAAAALELMRSPELANRAGSAAHAWARTHVDANAVAEAQIARAAEVLRQHPPSHRA